MSMDGHGRGTLGEVRAEQWLAEQGYEILARNYRAPGSEIDLIADDGVCIVFAEVKLRTGARTGSGREAVTAAKQRRICQGAMRYILQNGLTNRQVRFDVIEIQSGRITQIKDAFPYQGPVF